MPITLKTVFLILALIAAVPSASAQPCRDDEMAIQILGSGGPFVNPHRASTSHIVWLDGRSRILVDVRGGTFLRFGQAEARLADLSVILISHLHPDHVSDLPALLWLSNVARKDPLPLVGPDGNDSVPSVSTFLSRLFDGRQGGFPMLSATLGGSRSTVPLEVTVVNPSRQGHSPVFDRNGITVSAMAVPHANVPSIAYRVRTGQGTVVFGSDQSGENLHVAEFASNADVLVMHLTIGAGETLRGHASPALVGRVAAAAHARQLVLSHIGPFDLDRAVAEVRKHYGGPVVAGSDLQCIAVRK